MAAEAPTAILDNAWGHIPQTREATAGIGSFTRTRVERIISLVAGFGSLALGTQAFLIALGPPDEAPGWHDPAGTPESESDRGKTRDQLRLAGADSRWNCGARTEGTG